MRIYLLILVFIFDSFASDWLMLQGTDPKIIKKDGIKVKNTIFTPQLWGFAQLRAEKNYSDTYEKNGINKTGFAYVTPNLKRQNQIQITRARLGLRGTLNDDNTINYFTLTDFAYNGIHEPTGETQHTYITDASLTFRYIPAVNIRVGLMKYPGSEEGLQARFASPFINFTQMSNFLLLEKTPKDSTITNDTFVGKADRSIGAFRDTGVMLFDRFSIDDDWSFTYGAMLGNGSGLQWNNENNGHFTGYGYLSIDRSFHKGKGYDHEDFKTYVWYQDGKRALEGSTELFQRTRYGAGLRYYKSGLRVEAEYTRAEGMVFSGVRDSNPISGDMDWNYSIEAGRHNKAYGYYLSSAYEFYPKVEAMLRYDELDNLTNSALKEREFRTTTLGLTYHFDGSTRVDLNYLIRDAKAPKNSAAQVVMDKIDNVISLQLTYKFGLRL